MSCGLPENERREILESAWKFLLKLVNYPPILSQMLELPLNIGGGGGPDFRAPNRLIRYLYSRRSPFVFLEAFVHFPVVINIVNGYFQGGVCMEGCRHSKQGWLTYKLVNLTVEE